MKSTVDLKLIHDFVSDFPEMDASFGYGSAFFPSKSSLQSNDNGPYTVLNRFKLNLLDFVFVVQDPVDWHLKNMKMHPSHYSTLPRRLGSNALSFIQEYGAGVYYNPIIPISNSNLISKYGVVSLSRLSDDLMNWSSLYLAGRLHKPVMFLQPPSNDLRQLIQSNYSLALIVATAILPRTFSRNDLLREISSLSYRGDIRHSVNADVTKAQSISHDNTDMWNLYEGFLKCSGLSFDDSAGIVNQKYHDHRCNTTGFPLEVRKRSNFREWIGKNELQKILSDIVSENSLKQSLKGIYTAGFGKSILYSLSKLAKIR